MVKQKESYSQSTNKIIYLFNLIVLLKSCQSIVLRSTPEIQTRLVVVYNNSVLEMPALTTSNFTLVFTAPFANTPAVAVGNGGYYSLDRYFNEFWALSSSVLSNLTGLTIHVRLQSNTKTNILYISYLAVDDIPLDSDLFNIYYTEYNSTQLVNSSNSTTSRGNVTDKLYYTPIGGINFRRNSIVTCVNSKVYMRCSGDFGLIVDCALFLQFNSSNNETYSNSLIITIQAVSTIILDSIGFYSIILNHNIIKFDNYYQSFIGSISAFSTNTSSIYYTINFTQSSVSNYTSTSVSQVKNSGFFMGLKSFMGAASDNIGFNWEYQLDSSSIHTIKIKNNFVLDLLIFDFFIFGVVDCAYYWSVPMQSCVTSCASNETSEISSTICRLCTSNCETCSFTTSNCTSCSYGQYYFESYTCNTCNSSNLTDSQKLACGIAIDQPTTNTTDSTVKVETNTPYWLGVLAIIPIAAILVICYCRKNRITKIQLRQRSTAAQHPSIEL